MHGGARDADPVLERLSLSAEAGEGREERGVDIEGAPAEVLDIGRGQDPHIARVADQTDPALLEGGNDRLLVCLPARVLLRVDDERLDAVAAGDVERGSRRAVGYQHD